MTKTPTEIALAAAWYPDRAKADDAEIFRLIGTPNDDAAIRRDPATGLIREIVQGKRPPSTHSLKEGH